MENSEIEIGQSRRIPEESREKNLLCALKSEVRTLPHLVSVAREGCDTLALSRHPVGGIFLSDPSDTIVVRF